jgi:ribosomal protein L32
MIGLIVILKYGTLTDCEILICPKCGAYTLHDNHDIGVPNWGNPICECEKCGNMILESEFEYLK